MVEVLCWLGPEFQLVPGFRRPDSQRTAEFPGLGKRLFWEVMSSSVKTGECPELPPENSLTICPDFYCSRVV